MATELVKYRDDRYRSGLALPEATYEEPLDTGKQSDFEKGLAQANIRLPAEYGIFLSQSDGFHAPGICFHGSKKYPGAPHGIQEKLLFSIDNDLIRFNASLSNHFLEDMDNRVGLGETNGYVFLFNHAAKPGQQYERHSYRINMPSFFQTGGDFSGIDSSLTLVRRYSTLSAMLLGAEGLDGSLSNTARSPLQVCVVN